MDFTGKVALVTGAARGIGKAIATGLAKKGASVCINDMLTDEISAAAAELAAFGGKTLPVRADITKDGDVAAMFDLLLKEFGTIDILVNNAGIGDSFMVEDMPADVWRRVIDVDLTGAFLCCKAALPTMQRNNYGKIVNISSVAAKKISYHGGAHYTAAKAGLLAFTRHLAYEQGCFGINVNAVCPGATLTPLLRSSATASQLEAEIGRFPLGRFCEPEDIANAVLFLCSEKSRMITGQALDIDAGELLGWQDTTTYRKARKAYAEGVSKTPLKR